MILSTWRRGSRVVSRSTQDALGKFNNQLGIFLCCVVEEHFYIWSDFNFFVVTC